MSSYYLLGSNLIQINWNESEEIMMTDERCVAFMHEWLFGMIKLDGKTCSKKKIIKINYLERKV